MKPRQVIRYGPAILHDIEFSGCARRVPAIWETLRVTDGIGHSESGRSQDVAPSKEPRYEKQPEDLNPFRLLLLEVLYGGEIFKNEEFRK